MKKIIASLMAITIALSFTSCNDGPVDTRFKITMVTDVGGVHDQSFNQSSWEGLEKLGQQRDVNVNYIESTQNSDFLSNLDKAEEGHANLILGIGYSIADALVEAARTNPDVSYISVDNYYKNPLDNVSGITFRAQESAFLVGYIAGKSTKTNKVGFVGGMVCGIIDQFEYGYKAGVDYAAKEMGKKIHVVSRYEESFTDAAKGKAIASAMYSDGCDIIFHAAGPVGEGIFAIAKESGKFAIGVDRDQSYLAPDNILTSALKLVGNAVEILCNEAIDGKAIGGKNYNYGLKEGCVAIPEFNKNLDPAIYDAAMALKQKIINDEIVPPYNKETYDNFKV